LGGVFRKCWITLSNSGDLVGSRTLGIKKKSPRQEARNDLADDRRYRDEAFRYAVVNLIVGWAAAETWFTHIFAKLMRIDDGRAQAVMGSITTTRARVDLVQRIAVMCLSDVQQIRQLNKLCQEFRSITTLRNTLVHAYYERWSARDNLMLKALRQTNFQRSNFDGTNAFEVREITDEFVEEIEKAARRAFRLTFRFGYFEGHLQYFVSKLPRDTPLPLELVRKPKVSRPRRKKHQRPPRRRRASPAK
jgi:hypothetical protein